MQVYLDGIGVWGAGLRDWPHLAGVLARDERFEPDEIALPSPAMLPPAERRRLPGTARIALHVAAEACAMAGADTSTLASVFASSHGDTEITDHMCRDLAMSSAVSPTRFHNSVHNAPSGYWTIAAGCTAGTSAITAGVDSFAAGLLEAASQVATSDASVLLVSYDLRAPAPLWSVCPVTFSFGVALVLSPRPSPRTIAAIGFGGNDKDAPVDLPGNLQALVTISPSSRCLSLLALVARKRKGTVHLPPGTWEVTPWQ